MGTIRFELRKEKIDKDGKCPIRLTYQIKSGRKYFHTPIKITPCNWDAKTQQAIFIKKGEFLKSEVDEINVDLFAITNDVRKIEKKFAANNNEYEPEMVINELKGLNKPLGKKGTSSKEVYAFIDKYITDNIGTRVKGSLSVYRAVKMHLQGYESKTGQKIRFDKVDYAFFQSFQNYLVHLTKEIDGKTIKALNNITIAKQLSSLKTLLNYAKKQDIEVSPKYQSFKIERKNDLEVIALSQSEFQTLYNLDLSKKPAWDYVRDVFIFSCVSGLRFSDVQQLRREHIKEGYITLTIIKTGRKRLIPLNPYSLAILKKYEKYLNPLPVISNQKTNEHLHNICKYAGINEPTEIVRKHGSARVVNVYPKYELISFHASRKTFASLSLEGGMAADLVMAIGGWESWTSFARYNNITKERTMKAMSQTWTINPKLKAV